MPQGLLYLVVGPSGAGKDTLIKYARMRRPDLALMPRTITRPAPNGEHIAVSINEFAALRRNGQFALSWDANGARYGISRSLSDDLRAGRSVIVNGSRSIVNEARARFSPIRIIYVVATLDILARRLRERGREDEEMIDSRLGRAMRDAPNGGDVVTVDNSGALEESIEAFLKAFN